jgi:hypothetical protein
LEKISKRGHSTDIIRFIKTKRIRMRRAEHVKFMGEMRNA